MIDKNKKGSVTWESPSNIALVKYWGKKGIQIPCNPSISMTLKNAVTKMKMDYYPRQKGNHLNFEFEGKAQPIFEQRISKFLDGLNDDFSFIQDFGFSIFSENTFPHSTGIASSASAMSALALCLCSMQEDIYGVKLEVEEFNRKASCIARLGSGSASRSVYRGYAVWGESNAFSKSSNDYAVPFAKYLHPIFDTYQDMILLVSSEKKKVSSTAGHQLMKNHPYADARFAQANANFEKTLGVLRSGDLENFVELVENEALSLHGLMMNSNPSFTLLKPNTLEAIERIRKYRVETKIPLCFTLDAGPNIHLLFQKSDFEKVNSFVNSELVDLLENGKYLLDEKGKGPRKLK